MPRQYESVYLKHVLDAIGRIEEYVEGVDETAFLRHDMLQDAVIRQTASSVRPSSGCRVRRGIGSHVPWQDIAGMRDKLVHDYLGVDVETVWLTVKDDLPMLKADIVRIIGG